MASKKGTILTAVILIGIAAASFVVYTLPQNSPATYVISDYEEHLNRVKEIHLTLVDSTKIQFKEMLEGKTDPKDYRQSADITTSQINSMIIETVESRPSQEWQESYIQYVESLKSFNSYLRETMVIAKQLEDNKSADISEPIKNAERFLADSISYSRLSDENRP